MEISFNPSTTLRTALASFPLPHPVHLVLSGHMHRFQTVDFRAPSGLPTQLIVGNSGVALVNNFRKDPFSVIIGGATADGFGLRELGYMDIVLTDGGSWTGRMRDRKGKTLVHCDSRHPSETGACAPAGK